MSEIFLPNIITICYLYSRYGR